MSRIRANNITNIDGTGAPLFPNGLSVSGIATATTFIGNVTGTATTAQGLTGTPNITVGVVTATSFSGNGANLTGITGKAAAMALVFGG